MSRDGRVAEDDYFFSEQKARVVLNAERYYRTMFAVARRGRVSHYFHASLPRQFDFVVHTDTSHAVEALEARAAEHTGEPMETYPTGM